MVLGCGIWSILETGVPGHRSNLLRRLRRGLQWLTSTATEGLREERGPGRRQDKAHAVVEERLVEELVVVFLVCIILGGWMLSSKL